MTDDKNGDRLVTDASANRDAFAARIKKLITEAGGASALARTCELSESVIRKWAAGGSEPSRDHLIALARGSGVMLDWLILGVGPMRPGAASSDLVYIPIPRMTHVEGGREIEVKSEIAQVAIHRKWLEQKGLATHDIVSIRMPDDSMGPTVRQGGLVVIDASTDQLRGDGLYALWHDGGFTVRRLQVDFGGGVWIRCDNQAYREQHLAADQAKGLQIIGRVIWAGGEV